MSIPNETEPVPAAPPSRGAGAARWAPLLVALAIAAAYAGSLGGPFVLDDITSIRDNPTLVRLWPPWQALSPPRGEGLTPNGRPLVNLSLAVNRAVSGEAVWSYHLFNVAVHILAGLALYGIARRTLERRRRAGQAGEGRSLVPAAAIALLWALHPLQTESVTYIVQRAESMMGLFYLVTLYCFIRGADGAGTRARVWQALSVGACLLGMASKEVMVSAPLIVLLYDRTFVSGTFADAWRRHRSVFIGLAATWILLAYEVSITGSRGGTAGFGARVGWWDYALTQFPAIAHYLRLCVWPHPLVFDYGMGVALQKGRVIPSAIMVVLLLAGTVRSLARPGPPGSASRALGFAGAWFFAILAPTSSVMPVATQTMAEHRMYLPLAAVTCLAVCGGLAFLERVARPAARRRLLAAALVVSGVLGILTAARNRDYRSNIALWTATARDYPRNMRALYNLGVSLTEAGQIEEAVRNYETVVRNQPDYADAHQNLANCLVKLGRVEDSLIHYEIAASAHPDSSDIQCSLGIALLDTDRVEPAIRHLREALRIKPGLAEAVYQLGEALLRAGRPLEGLPLLESAAKDRPESAEVRNALGNALFRVGRAPEADKAYQEALRIDPAYAEAHNNLGNLRLQAGRTAEAVAEFRAALEARPAFAEAHNNLGDALLAAGATSAAAGEFQAAVGLKPDSVDAHYNLANSLARLGRSEEAAAQYREVLRIQPAHPEARNNLGIALAGLGRLVEAREQFEEALRLRPDFADARDNLARLRELQKEP